MALSPGTRLGPYEILAPLGAGGMGEVYKAKDTRLDRIVAIKVLPEHLAESPERKKRFEREAKAISQFNHPHICTLHDVGSQDGTDFLVMEYIEGDALAETLKRGALPLDKALEYGTQIADGLDRAHRHGVVHRDLKPGNIMLTKSGVKLLDFGLAKLVHKKPVAYGSDAPTQTRDLTQTQAILGTIPYMAPEQLESKDVDARTDIFAFGAVLHEMLTGARAFKGETQASLISAIMTSDPKPVSVLRSMTPPALDHVIRTCLAKDPEERWQAAGDVARQLKWIGSGEAQRGPDRVEHRRLPWAVPAAVAFVLGGIGVWIVRPPPPPPPLPTRFAVTLPPDQVIAGPTDISPDGRRLVYAGRDDTRRLYLRDFDTFEVRPLPGTEGADNPFFSPDGQWVGFRANGMLQKIAIRGGAPLILCEAPSPFTLSGASWGEDDTIIFAPDIVSGLFRVSADGGEPEQITAPAVDEGEVGHVMPHHLPDGENLLFTLHEQDDWFIALLSRQTGTYRKLFPGSGFAKFLSPGYILFARSGGLLAVPFDLDRLEAGAPVPVLEGLQTARWAGADIAFFTVSENGSLAYVPGGDVASSLLWVDRKGRTSSLSEERGRFFFPRLSPDGRRLAVTDQGIEQSTGSQIWIYDLERGSRRRLTTTGTHFVPSWSPDGRRLAFGPLLQVRAADGSDAARRITRGDHRQYPISWTPDGRELLFFEVNPVSGGDIRVVSPSGDEEPRPLLTEAYRETSARLSPDGNWLAYTSNESGRDEVYVQPYPGPGGKVSISTEGGREPAWSREGRELYYRHGARMMGVEVKTQPRFAASAPRLLFEGRFQRDPCCAANYDVTADGERFVMIQGEGGGRLSQIHVITNWVEELKRVVGTQ